MSDAINLLHRSFQKVLEDSNNFYLFFSLLQYTLCIPLHKGHNDKQ